MFGLFAMGFPNKFKGEFDWSQIGPKTKAILEKYSINPKKHTVYSGLLQYNEIEENYPLTIQERIDINQENLQFVYKMQEGEREMQSHIDNLVTNPYFKYHIQLENVPIYFVELEKIRNNDVKSITSHLQELEELLWEDEEFVSQFNKD